MSRPGQAETHHTSPHEWGRDITMCTYVPMLAADVVSLYTFGQYLEQGGHRVPRQLLTSTTTKRPFFFGSHPVQYIQVAGYVVAPIQRNTFPQCSFELHDGLSEQRCRCIFAELAPIVEGQFVCVLGEVSYFNEPQIRAHQIQWFHPSLAREFMFKQESLDIRRFVLEQPVDDLKEYATLWAHKPGRPVLTEFVRGLPSPPRPPPFTQICKSLESKAKTWGFQNIRDHAAHATRTTHIDSIRAQG